MRVHALVCRPRSVQVPPRTLFVLFWDVTAVKSLSRIESWAAAPPGSPHGVPRRAATRCQIREPSSQRQKLPGRLRPTTAAGHGAKPLPQLGLGDLSAELDGLFQQHFDKDVESPHVGVDRGEQPGKYVRHECVQPGLGESVEGSSPAPLLRGSGDRSHADGKSLSREATGTSLLQHCVDGENALFSSVGSHACPKGDAAEGCERARMNGEGGEDASRVVLDFRAVDPVEDRTEQLCEGWLEVVRVGAEHPADPVLDIVSPKTRGGGSSRGWLPRVNFPAASQQRCSTWISKVHCSPVCSPRLSFHL